MNSSPDNLHVYHLRTEREKSCEIFKHLPKTLIATLLLLHVVCFLDNKPNKYCYNSNVVLHLMFNSLPPGKFSVFFLLLFAAISQNNCFAKFLQLYNQSSNIWDQDQARQNVELDLGLSGSKLFVKNISRRH